MEDITDHTIVGTIAFNLASREPCVDFYLMNENLIEYPNILKPYIERIESQEDILTVLNDFIKQMVVLKTLLKNHIQI